MLQRILRMYIVDGHQNMYDQFFLVLMPAINSQERHISSSMHEIGLDRQTDRHNCLKYVNVPKTVGVDIFSSIF